MGRLQTLAPRVKSVTLTRVSQATTRTDRMTGRPLQRRNRLFLREHPLCVACEKLGRVCAAVEVDHIVPLHLGGPDHESNLQGLCVPCHAAKSKAEGHARAG